MGERIINRNPYLYGPGPVKRVPKGMFTFYSRMPPIQGFALAAGHAVVLGLIGSFAFKFMIGDPQIRAIEEYYKENRTLREVLLEQVLLLLTQLTLVFCHSQLLAKLPSVSHDYLPSS